jgi:L-ribulose-5-phosphate 4-epimerase
MLEQLKERVCEANLRLVREGLVLLTWGNVSAIDREEGLIVIKPSGVPYGEMTPETMVVVSLDSGKTVAGTLNPSSDTPTHRELYRAFPAIGGIAHSHSLYATVWAQAKREIPPYGTTHADHFFGTIPCTRDLRNAEIASDYELNTGKVIVERYRELDPLSVPGVLVAGHGPFAWGDTVEHAVENAIVLERVARMASETVLLNRSVKPLKKALLEKHFHRKHGKYATYGQRKK